MKYTLSNGRVIEISDNSIRNLMDACDCSKEEALDIWLTDHGFIVNEKQEELNKKAKNCGIRAQSGTKTSKKTHEVKVSAEKRELFSEILSDLEDVYRNNVKILKENKLIEVKIGKKTFKVDIIEQRPSKN